MEQDILDEKRSGQKEGGARLVTVHIMKRKTSQWRNVWHDSG